MKAHMGDTDYFVLSMKAGELADKVKIPREMDDWVAQTIEERYQRDLDYNRVKSQIAPYLANNPSRFFGAVIVAAKNFDPDDAFEPIGEMGTRGLPKKYKKDAEPLGLLNFQGGEVLVPLDGQHRLKAIQFAVSGKDERGKDISAIPTPCAELADEDIAVILIDYNLSKARDIFTHVNLNAKKPTTGQSIVTNDDDPVAVLARVVTNKIIGARLVKFTSNTLTKKDQHFTTLSIVYNANEEIIKTSFPNGALKKDQMPSNAQMNLYKNKVSSVWDDLVKKIQVFADAVADPEPPGDAKRDEIRSNSLLGKPVAQECLVKAYTRLVGPKNNYSGTDACARLNKLPWAQTSENLAIWDRVLWNGGTNGKVITKNRGLITDMMIYMAGGKFNAEEKAQLLKSYQSQFPDEERANKDLPPVFAQ
jgi:DNA sulfur modification protein DndB